MSINVVIFARVSRKDQSYDRQANELQEHSTRQGWKVAETITEKISGSKTQKEDRPAIDQLLRLASSGQINKVLISEVSRIGRKTMDVLEIIEKLHQFKVSLYIYNYQLETLNSKGQLNSMAQFLITLLADIGRMEAVTLGERISSGLDEARRKGKTLGRKQGSTKSPEELMAKYPGVVKDLKAGDSIRKIAAFREISVDTVQRVKKALSEN